MLFNESPYFNDLTYGYENTNLSDSIFEFDFIKGYALIIPRKKITGWYITELRKLYDLQQKVISKKLGITQAQYSKYENGKDQLSTEILVRFANVFNTSTDFISGNKIHDKELELERKIYKKIVTILYESDLKENIITIETIDKDIDYFIDSLKLINTKILHTVENECKTIKIKKHFRFLNEKFGLGITLEENTNNGEDLNND